MQYNATRILYHLCLQYGWFLFYFADLKILDDFIVNGSGREISRFSAFLRKMQSGYLYHYVLVMIIGLLGLLIWMWA